jgi:hypothetical protein
MVKPSALRRLLKHSTTLAEARVSGSSWLLTSRLQGTYGPICRSMGPLDVRSLHRARKKFDQFDVDKSGFLKADEVKALTTWVPRMQTTCQRTQLAPPPCTLVVAMSRCGRRFTLTGFRSPQASWKLRRANSWRAWIEMQMECWGLLSLRSTSVGRASLSPSSARVRRALQDRRLLGRMPLRLKLRQG